MTLYSDRTLQFLDLDIYVQVAPAIILFHRYRVQFLKLLSSKGDQWVQITFVSSNFSVITELCIITSLHFPIWTSVSKKRHHLPSLYIQIAHFTLYSSNLDMFSYPYLQAILLPEALFVTKRTEKKLFMILEILSGVMWQTMQVSESRDTINQRLMPFLEEMDAFTFIFVQRGVSQSATCDENYSVTSLWRKYQNGHFGLLDMTNFYFIFSYVISTLTYPTCKFRSFLYYSQFLEHM